MIVLIQFHNAGIKVPGLITQKIEKKAEEPEGQKTEGGSDKKEATGQSSEKKATEKGKKKEFETVFTVRDADGGMKLWKI